MKKIIVVAAAALMAIAIAGPGSAHVTANPSEGPAEGFFKTSFRVGHGCEGSPTTEVSVQLPGNVSSVHPQVVAGWDIETKMGDLDEPIESEGQTITEGVREITWTATDGGLPDAYLQEFGVSMALPAGEAGEPLWFPLVQKCPGGDSHEWIEIPDSVEEWGELESPAPYAVLTDAEGGNGDEADAEETATSGNGGGMTGADPHHCRRGGIRRRVEQLDRGPRCDSRSHRCRFRHHRERARTQGREVVESQGAGPTEGRPPVSHAPSLRAVLRATPGSRPVFGSLPPA